MRYFMPLSVVISCEHAGNAIPKRWESYFKNADSILASHRGFDIGAHALARQLALQEDMPLYAQEYSRLLVDCNRSLDSPSLFSSYSKKISPEDKKEVLTDIYTPYRQGIELAIRRRIGEGMHVLHLSIHTFTPLMNGKTRPTAIGLLFDPKRDAEKRFCYSWRQYIEEVLQGNIHFNLPYRGWSDGLTTTLRSLFSEPQYLGIEIEVNQKFFMESSAIWHDIGSALASTLPMAIERHQPEHSL